MNNNLNVISMITYKQTHRSVKVLSIISIIFLINLIFILNFEFSSSQSELSNDVLRPELQDFWEYERSDYSDNSVYRYNLTAINRSGISKKNYNSLYIYTNIFF